MWDSTLTDEFYVAVREFDLTWSEVVTLSRNSLAYALVAPAVKQQLIDDFDQEIQRFERRMQRGGLAKVPPMPDTRAFICARYKICD